MHEGTDTGTGKAGQAAGPKETGEQVGSSGTRLKVLAEDQPQGNRQATRVHCLNAKAEASQQLSVLEYGSLHYK